MVNKVILVGHLGKSPEIRSTATGRPVGNFSLATNRKWRDQQGQMQEETEWHQIVVWGRQAEIAGQYLTKGKLVYIEGRMQTRSWEDRQTGEKGFKTEVVCENFQMLGGRGEGRGRGGGGQHHGGNYGATPQDPAGGWNDRTRYGGQEQVPPPAPQGGAAGYDPYSSDIWNSDHAQPGDDDDIPL